MMARYAIAIADFNGMVSGQPPDTTQFSIKNGKATIILPAVIAIGWKSGFCCFSNTEPSDCVVALMTIANTPSRAAVEIDMLSTNTTARPISPNAIPDSLVPDKRLSFKIILAITLVIIGDNPKTTDTQPEGMYWAAQ